MQPTSRNQVIVAATVATALVLGLVAGGQAALISSSTAVPTADGSNIDTSGVVATVLAVNSNGSGDADHSGSVDAAGVTWLDDPPASVTNITGLTTFLADRESFEGDVFVDPFQEVMDDLALTNGTTDGNNPTRFSFDITGLTVGATYRLQTLHGWHTDPGGLGQMTLVLGTNGAADPKLTFDIGTKGSGDAVLATFVFTAESTTQTITGIASPLAGGRAGINGVLLQQVPEPGSLALLGLGGLVMLGRGWRRA